MATPSDFLGIPVVLIGEILQFYFGGCSGGLFTISVLSKTMNSIREEMTEDANCSIWEGYFMSFDLNLYTAMVLAKDERKTWRARFERELLRSKARNPTLTPAPKISRLRARFDEWLKRGARTPKHSTVEIALYNHPDDGLSINIGKLNRSVFLYAVRRSGNFKSKSFAESALEKHNVSFKETETDQVLIQRRPLLIVSIDGRNISSFPLYIDFIEFLEHSKSMNEVTVWRFLDPGQLSWSLEDVRQESVMFPEESLFGV
jgi:hypothetical protein